MQSYVKKVPTRSRPHLNSNLSAIAINKNIKNFKLLWVYFLVFEPVLDATFHLKINDFEKIPRSGNLQKTSDLQLFRNIKKKKNFLVRDEQVEMKKVC